jgi:hypothetical protein
MENRKAESRAHHLKMVANETSSKTIFTLGKIQKRGPLSIKRFFNVFLCVFALFNRVLP